MITYAEALQKIESLTPIAATEILPLAQAAGRELAETLTATIPSPPFTNSAMDGFAVRHADVRTGTVLKIVGAIYARPIDLAELPQAGAGECVRIMTGGYLPDWADTVIPVEKAMVDGDSVRFIELPESGANVRHRGDDLPADAPLMGPGTRLNAERLMTLAAFGHAEVKVRAWPRVHLVATGDELTEPGKPLKPGAIYNSSRFFLTAATQELGLPLATSRTLPDRPREAGQAIQRILNDAGPRLIVSTGAVSAGDADFIPQLAVEMGFTPLFHKVAMRPGKPIFIAQLGDTVWVGLPGNPVSTAVGWHHFVHPLVTHWAGLPPPRRVTVRLAHDVHKPEGLTCFFRAETRDDKAWLPRRQGSAELAASINQNVYVELPIGTARLAADTPVAALLI
jgi:molybdopterin molybdotransferase